jgi:hypothetical protein
MRVDEMLSSRKIVIFFVAAAMSLNWRHMRNKSSADGNENVYCFGGLFLSTEIDAFSRYKRCALQFDQKRASSRTCQLRF